MLVTFQSPNSHVLYSNTAPVTSGDQAVAIIAALEEEMAKIGPSVGLAATQIGMPFSVAIIRYGGASINLINPTIIEGEREFIHRDEGCMSFPKRRFDVPRFGTIRIKNHILWPSETGTVPIDEDPNKRPIDHKNLPKGMHLVPIESVYVYENHDTDGGGIVSIAVQHEIEHLSGMTIDKKHGSIEKTIAGSVNVGRNDPCPCGSGKKYKKCCLGKPSVPLPAQS